MSVDSFFICFWQFYFLTQSDDFAKSIAFVWRPLLPIFKMVSLFEYYSFFRAVFIFYRNPILRLYIPFLYVFASFIF